MVLVFTKQAMLLTIIMLCVAACIIKDDGSQTKFWPISHLDQFKVLMPHIFKRQWQIGYRYSVDCQPADRQNGEALQQAISDSLRVWLKPIKELQPARPLVDKFVYKLQADFNPDQPKDKDALRAVDLQVTFDCINGASTASIQLESNPAVFIRPGTELTPRILSSLTHELGHAFGLADTYVRAGIPSSGGLRRTAGKQPASVMAMGGDVHGDKLANAPLAISEDDKRGIIWLYRFFFDKQAVEDCFFADYIFIEGVRGCQPKHPLIFEAKHNHPMHTLQILKDDPDLNVNAQDVNGMTALHYAVLYEKVAVVKALLAHEDIKPLLKNKHGDTPRDIAHAINNNAIVGMFPKDKQEEESKPPSLNVAPKNKVITTWGAIKKE